MTVWVTAAKAHRWPWALVFALLLGGLALDNRRTVVEVPMIDWLVPLPLLVAIASTAIGVLPLYSTFGTLEPTLYRAGMVRLRNLALSLVLVVVVCAPAAIEPATAGLAALVYAASLVAVVVIGEYAWSVGLALGLAAVMSDGSVDQPVSTAIESVPGAVFVLLVGGAALLYWRVGPRESRAAPWSLNVRRGKSSPLGARVVE